MGFFAPDTTAQMIRKAQKAGKDVQFAALAYRVKKNKTQVLLITSRGSRQWILPKGWPMLGYKPHKAAAREAWEEAGVIGDVRNFSLGQYRYRKERGSRSGQKIRVVVFPLKVKKLASSYREAGQRNRIWLPPKKAAKRIRNPELAALVRDFDHKKLLH